MALMCDMFHQGYRTVDELRTSGVLCVCGGGGAAGVGVMALMCDMFHQGYRTVDELRTSGVLNRQQTIGVRHYDDFIERMSREEVAEIEDRVCECVCVCGWVGVCVGWVGVWVGVRVHYSTTISLPLRSRVCVIP